jgi:hypothetical protein
MTLNPASSKQGEATTFIIMTFRIMAIGITINDVILPIVTLGI